MLVEGSGDKRSARMISAFKAFIEDKKLFVSQGRVLAAVSGGVDSVTLCHLLKIGNYKFSIAHCNFNLRGEEAREDEDFVRQLADKLDVKFYSVHFQTSQYAEANKLSIQEAARDLRYQWLEQIRTEHQFDKIAVAHHKNDSVETFIFNICRGTGIAGLHGIKERHGNIVRPLLFASKDQILSFAKENQIEFREDVSNKSLKYARNRIRNEIIPLLKQINPAVDNHILDEINRLKEVEGIYNDWIVEKQKQFVVNEGEMLKISISELLEIGFVESLLFETLKPYGFHGKIIQDINNSLSKDAGKIFKSQRYILLKDREFLILKKNKATINEEYSIKENTIVIKEPVNLKIKKIEKDTDFQIPKNKSIACLDFKKLEFPLTLRRWQSGDYFFPIGMRGKKKLSDFFIDEKFSLFDKENSWLLTSGNNVVWIVGCRLDNRFKIGNDTKMVYLLSLE